MIPENTPDDYQYPEWEKYEIRTWKHYIGKDLIRIWQTFTDRQKATIAANAKTISDKHWQQCW